MIIRGLQSVSCMCSFVLVNYIEKMLISRMMVTFVQELYLEPCKLGVLYEISQQFIKCCL